MQQQNKTFYSIADFAKHDKSTLTDIDLQLNNCNINEESLKKLNSQLAQVSQIQSLKISLKDKYIKDSQVMLLFKDLNNFQNLSGLLINFQGSLIQKQGAKFLSQLLQKCLKLTKLSIKISGIYFGSKELCQILQAITVIRNLQLLEVYLGNKFDIDNEQATAISKTLKILDNSLTNLIISFTENNIDDEGAYLLGLCLTHCNNLKYLDLCLCFDEKLLYSKDIQDCKNLKVLYISQYYCESKEDKILVKRKALKIKRIVKLYFCDY
ncbi:hypothetical protein ABPG72_011497 [Tetrahymena utriculariae]